MMKTLRKTLIISALMFVAGTFALYAEAAVLQYSEGIVEQKTTADKWMALNIGDSVSTDKSIRVSGNGLAEFQVGAVMLHLTKDGTYQLSTLFAQAQKRGSSSVANDAVGKASKLFGNGKSTVPTAVGGVRGADQSGPALQWADDDSADSSPAADVSDPVVEIKGLIDQGKLDVALTRIDQVLKAKTGDPEALHLLRAQIFAQKGSAAVALRELALANIKRGEAHFLEAQLLLVSQSIEVGDYDTALARSTDALALNTDADIKQSLLILQGLAYRGAGQQVKANASFKAAVDAGPGTDAGKQASSLIGK